MQVCTKQDQVICVSSIRLGRFDCTTTLYSNKPVSCFIVKVWSLPNRYSACKYRDASLDGLSFLVYLKWSYIETSRSNESERSRNPTPMNAQRPEHGVSTSCYSTDIERPHRCMFPRLLSGLRSPKITRFLGDT